MLKTKEISVKRHRYKPVSKARIVEAVNGNVRSSILIGSLLDYTGLSLIFLAENVFEVTPKTLSKYRNDDVKLPSSVIELSFKLKDLYSLGLGIFGSKEKLNLWLNTPSYGLGNIIPASLLKTASGIDIVYEELTRIAYGATA
jgi:putative toxin-antitoxin system antitoxin component (TIGR02293 family)